MAKNLSASVVIGAAALALAACQAPQPPATATIPIATAYPASAQPKMQAANHWEVLAGEVARQVSPSVKSSGRQVFVPAREPRSPFYDGFRGMLVEALVNEGVSVATSPADALTLNYNVQVVRHQAPRTGFAAPASDPPTNTEAIVSAEIVNGNQVAFKTNRIYYVNPEDATAQYQPPPGRPVIPTQARAVRATN